MDDYAKWGKFASELLIVILCGPNFAVSQCFEPEIIQYLFLSLNSVQFQFETQMSSNNDVLTFKCLSVRGITVKSSQNIVRPLLAVLSS